MVAIVAPCAGMSRSQAIEAINCSCGHEVAGRISHGPFQQWALIITRRPP